MSKVGKRINDLQARNNDRLDRAQKKKSPEDFAAKKERIQNHERERIDVLRGGRDSFDDGFGKKKDQGGKKDGGKG